MKVFSNKSLYQIRLNSENPNMTTIHEPIIQVGILSANNICFNLNGTFLDACGNEYSGSLCAEYRDGMILFDGEEFFSLEFTPVDLSFTFDLPDVIIGIGFHWERKENQRFNGKLIIIVENESLTAINGIDVERYLTSVISSEMSATASDELLKAHAVISRSWLLKPILNPQKNANTPTIFVENNRLIKWYERDAHVSFDVCADDHCQRYQGITRASTPAVTKAIEATRGEVLMYGNEICDARFSKCCGGASESFENCWAPEHHPYLTKVMDNPSDAANIAIDLTIEENAQKWIRQSPEAFCNTTDKNILAQVLNNYDQETIDFYRWEVHYNQQELATILHKKSGYDFGEIIHLEAVKRGESGRIIELKITGTKHTMTVGKELEIRKWLSESHLYSSAFVVDTSDFQHAVPQQFTLRGAGWGHGVGLCQIGAAVMGEKGYRYRDILMHYFRNAQLKRIY